MSDSNTFEVRNRMEIPLFKPGKDAPSIFSSADMNVLVRALKALTNPTIKRGTQDEAKLTDGNFLITIADDNGSASSAIKQYILKEYLLDDHMICRQWDGEDEIGEDVLIAKPWTLRRTPFDGETFDYVKEVWTGSTVALHDLELTFTYRSPTLRSMSGTVDGGSAVTEDQVIIPRFRVDSDIIYAGTVEDLGIEVAGELVTLLDLNVDGRAWMKQSA